MNPVSLIVAVSTAGGLTGVVLLVLAIRGREPDSAPDFVRSRRVSSRLSLRGKGPEVRARRLRMIAAAVALVGVWVLTGWPVAALLVSGGILAVPYLFGAAGQAKRRIARLEALEEWTRRMADSMASGSGTVQTIVRSAHNAPDAIAADVAILANRLSTPRWDKQAALRQFADTFDDAPADLVAIALGIAVSTQGARRVTDVLRDMAAQVSEEVAAQREIEADRAEPRSVARNILIILAVLVVAVVLAGQFTQPYGTPLGQMVLVALGAVTFTALLWMRRLQLGTPVPRILLDAPAPEAGEDQ
jgi:Flp pilus assembly protein TadB